MEIIQDSQPSFNNSPESTPQPQEDDVMIYTDPGVIAGGIIGDTGIMYIGSKQIRIDPKRGNMVWNDGTEDVITLGKLEDGSFGIDVADGKINGAWITAHTITADEIASHTITADEIAADTITATEIAADTITATEIAANAITSSELSAGAVIAGKISAGAINAANLIVDDTITADKLNVSTLSAITANLGTITAGSLDAVTIDSSTITLDQSTDNGASTAGYLNWGTGNNRISVTTGGYMALQAAGGRIYFYSNANLLMLLDYGGGSMNTYLPTYIGAGVTTNNAIFQVGDATHTQTSTFYGAMSLTGNLTITSGDIDMNGRDILDTDEVSFRGGSGDAGGTQVMYVKNGDLYYKDDGGAIVKLN